MKFTISQPAFAAALARGGSLAPKNSPAAIVNHVRLTAAAGKLKIASTNLDAFAEASTPAVVDDPGKTTVSAATLVALIGRYGSDKDVSVEVADGVMTVKCGRSKVRLPTLPAEDFPAWADEKAESSFELAGIEFAKAFVKTRPSADDSTTTSNLSGVYMHVEDGVMKFAATNRNHLALATMPAPEGSEEMPGAIVPARLIDTALRVLNGSDKVYISVGKNKIVLVGGDTKLASKLIEGPYPEYWRMITERGRPRLVVDRRDLAEAMARCSLTTEEGAYAGFVIIPRDDGVELKTMTSRGSETREGLEANADDGFEPFGFNASYIANISAGFDSEHMVLEYGGDRKPSVLIYSESDPSFMGMVGTVAINDTMVA